MLRRHRLALGLALATAILGRSLHAELPPDVLARNSWAELTRADYDAALARVPQKMRYEFASSPKRVQITLNNLLLTKTLASQARAHGLRPEVSFADRSTKTPLDEDRGLAAAELKRIEKDANDAFDAHKNEYDAKARELYQAKPDAYRTAEAVRLSDIAVLIKGRGEDAARARAAEARAKIMAGGNFGDVAREYSDDRTTRDKGGQLPFVTAQRMTPGYAKVVFGLKVGEISQPIEAPTAYHVVRLDERRESRLQSFDEVRESVLATLRARYAAEQRDLRLQSIYRDPKTEVNQPAIDALVTRVDPNTFRKPGKAAGS